MADDESSASLTARLAALLADFFRADEPWQPVSRWALGGWLGFYALYLLHALGDRDGFLLLHNVNLIAHEAGHLLFSWFGETAGLAGGPVGQFLVPLLILLSFLRRRHTLGVAFAAFWLFENCLDTATYIADARAQELPLVTVGDTEWVEHDWYRILSGLGLLQQDTLLAGLTRAVGWLGMLAVVAWLIRRARPA